MTALEQLPARIDDLTLQIVQLREEMHAAISASETSVVATLRAEIRAGDDALRRGFHDGFQEIRGEMQTLRAVVTGEMRAIASQIMSQARTLYEAMDAKLSLIDEVRAPSRRRRPKKQGRSG